MTAHIALNIDEIQIEGLRPMHKLRLQQALQQILTQRLSQPEMQAALQRAGQFSLDQVALTVRPGLLPEAMAGQIAQAVCHQLVNYEPGRTS